MNSPEGQTTTGKQRPVRVLMLLENCPYSMDGRVRCEANSLADAGYRVTVICPRAPASAGGNRSER